MIKNAQTPKYPGKRVTMNGNLLMAMTEALIAEGGVFYPITPSTEGGEMFELLYAKGQLNAFGRSFIAIEAEGEHAAQGSPARYFRRAGQFVRKRYYRRID